MSGGLCPGELCPVITVCIGFRRALKMQDWNLTDHKCIGVYTIGLLLALIRALCPVCFINTYTLFLYYLYLSK